MLINQVSGYSDPAIQAAEKLVRDTQAEYNFSPEEMLTPEQLVEYKKRKLMQQQMQKRNQQLPTTSDEDLVRELINTRRVIVSGKNG